MATGQELQTHFKLSPEKLTTIDLVGSYRFCTFVYHISLILSSAAIGFWEVCDRLSSHDILLSPQGLTPINIKYKK